MDKLPKGWELIELSSLCEFENGDRGKNYPSKSSFVDSGVPFINAGNLSNNKVDTINLNYISEAHYNKLSNGKLKYGDIVFCLRGSLGKFAVVDRELKGAIASSLVIVRPKENLDLSFLSAYFQSSISKKYIDLYDNGSAQPNLSAASLRKFKIPLPPLLEQKRIVSKLDALFKRIDKSMVFLEENITHTESLMASALDEIFEPLYERNDKLKNISKKIQYGYTGKTADTGEYYYLRITDIQNRAVNYKTTPFSDISVDEVQKYLLNKGDILFARTGATAGKSYLFNDNVKSVFASYLIRVVCNKDIIIPEFLFWFFQSDNYWRQVFDGIVGAAQPNFNGKKLGELDIPIPSLEMQYKAIEKIVSLNLTSQKLFTEQQDKLNNLKALKESILDKTFKGQI